MRQKQFTRVVAGVATFLFITLGLIILSPSARAVDDMSVNSHISYGNAHDYCVDWAKGMVWISNDPNNYYSETVTIGMDTTMANVQVRGTVNTCKTSLGDSDRKENRAYADKVKSLTSGLSINGTEFYRGSAPSFQQYRWTTKGHYLKATLNTSGVAVCTGTSGVKTGTVSVRIERQLVWRFISKDGSVRVERGGSGIENINVRVSRNCPEVVKPKVHILGADLVTLGNITTSTNSLSGKTYGSWGEYGVIAGGSITGMASGSGYAGGASSDAICSVSLLTFANSADSACSPSSLGNYSSSLASGSSIMQQMKSLPNKVPINGGVSIDSLDSGKVYTATGDITLTASSPIPKGKWVVVMADGHNVRINSSIQYFAGSLNSLREIPQVVVIGKNIVIDDSVSRIDAWLVAVGTSPGGILKTCDASGINEPSELTRNVCNTPLVVNGPVVARLLQLYRTSGDVKMPGINQPAELFNLRADAYVWAVDRKLITPRITTQSEIELPPRF